MRYYATCIDSTGNEVLLIAKAEKEEEAMDYLIEKYKLQQVVSISTKAPQQMDKSYYPSFAGIHLGKPMIQRTRGRGGAYTS